MEIKAQLNKPYEEKQRLDFIVEQNHKNGYEIKETETALEAWGYTDEEIAEQEKAKKIAEYKQALKELDEKSTRSIRAKLAGTSTEADDAYLASLEEQAEDFRRKIKELQQGDK
jgi:DNA-binding transcriptional MerR regulator